MRRAVLAGLGALAAVAVSAPSSLEAQTRREGYFPNLPVVTQDGKELRFYDDLIKDKIVVISFIYTSCPDICPLTTARMAQVEEKLGETAGRDIFLISITVDPENDTPQKLKAFSQAFHTGPGWQFVTGRPDDIRAINYKLGERSKRLSEHRNEIVLGNDLTGEWQRDNVLGDIGRVVTTIRAMDPKWRSEVRNVPHNPASDTGLAMSEQPGQAMFKKICAPCHTIGVGDRVGPDLRGVSARREHAWLKRYISNPHKLKAENDPVALALAARYPGVRMPILGVSERDAADLIAFLEAETHKLTASPAPAAPHQQHHHHGHRH